MPKLYAHFLLPLVLLVGAPVTVPAPRDPASADALPSTRAASAAEPDALRLKLMHELQIAQDPGPPAEIALSITASSARASEWLAAPLATDRLLAAILIFLLLNIAALVLSSIAMRFQRESVQRRRERFRARWEPLLYGRMSGDDDPLPCLARSERMMFLTLWLQLQGYVRDEAAQALVRAGRELDLREYVLRLLNDRSDWKRVVAMRAAASLRLEEACAGLLAKIAQDRPKSSLAAARALLQINPELGFAGLQRALSHLEWSPVAMVGIVKAGGSRAVQMLAQLVRSAPPGGAKQVVRLIEMIEDDSALPALRERLLSNQDDEETAAILHALGRLGGAKDRETALGFLAHASWLVRMQSASALGSLGAEPDCDRLLPLLRDGNWWVRYRSGQSLLRIKGPAAIAALRDGESDPYAREMLDRVLSEER